MRTVCSEPEMITPAWLTAALEESGDARGATVTDVDFVGWIGTGQVGRNARFHLAWDDPEGRPASVVAKCPSGNPEARATAFATGNYIKEFTFYDRIVQQVDIRAPHCYVARYDPTVPDFVLIMEDLAVIEQGDQLEGLSVERVSLAIEQLVGLHAPLFGSPKLETILDTGEPTPSREEVVAIVQGMYGMAMTGFLERLGPRLDPDVAQVCQDFGAHVGTWLAGTDTPDTLVHLDYRADNLLFGATPSAPPVVVVDWQTLSVGLGASDLAYLISGSFPDAAERAAVERDLVEEYRTRLAAAGHELSPDAMWRDYRFGSLWGLIITIVATMSAEQTERGDDMLTAMAQRHGRQAIDLEALNLVS